MVISFLQRHPKIAAGHIVAEDNLGAMLMEILELYGTRFNFDRVGIAIDNGGAYFEKLDYQLSNQKLWRQICIRDPNDPTNNIAKASHQADNIIRVFYDAFSKLTSRCYLVHERIQRGEAAPWGTPRGSLLDSIIETPRLVVRERLKRVWKQHMKGLDRAISESSEGNIPVEIVIPETIPEVNPPEKNAQGKKTKKEKALERRLEHERLKKESAQRKAERQERHRKLQEEGQRRKALKRQKTEEINGE